MRHVRTPAAAFSAKRFHTCAHQIDRAETIGQILGHRCGDAGLAIIHRDNGRDTCAKALFRFVEQRPQFLGVEPFEYLSAERYAADLFIGWACV